MSCILNTRCQYLFVIVLLLQSAGCNKKCKEEIDISDIQADIKVIRLEKELFNLKSQQVASELLLRYPKFSQLYFRASSNTDQLGNYLYNYYANKELAVLYQQADSTFKDFTELKKPLENFYGLVKHHYPLSVVPTVYTVVSGFQFEKDMIVTDSVVALSLDYFIGAKAKYRPPFYNYFLERYRKEYIVPMIALSVSNKYNAYQPTDETMLANMIYYGKAYYFAERTLPCVPDSLIVQYSSAQLEGIDDNIDLIWGHFIAKRLLFETKPTIVEKYVGESPRINEIGENCPGRIGRWLGWQIVKKYQEANPSLTLKQVMAEKDAQKIFRLSKYKPGKL